MIFKQQYNVVAYSWNRLKKSQSVAREYAVQMEQKD